VDASGFVAYNGSYRGASKIGVPAIATVHEVWQGEWFHNMGIINGLIGHILEQYYLRKPFDKYIAVSDFTKRKLIDRLGIKEERIKVIYNGVDLKLYESTLPEMKYPDPTIVTVCRLVEYKRVDDLIKAVALLKTHHPNLKLKIIGEGPEEEFLRELTREYDLEQSVEFLGKINDFSDIIKILKRSHIFALPSVAEGFGMVIIEAMASGIPYVASNIPPIYEITEGGTGGILYTPRSCTELAGSIEKLLTDERTYDEKVTSINGYVERYNWVSISATADQFYQRILSGDSHT
jgi:glycosyltransferase involved in cell wall biosynthesis